MCSVPIEVAAAERARVLAELSDALDRAHWVVAELRVRPDQRAEAEELYLRIEAAKLVVQALRLGRSLNVREENEPEWIDPLLWR